MDHEIGPIRFSGMIDRIDESDSGVRIVDYKSTIRVSKTAVKTGESLQLPIYALAWNAANPDKPCVEATFVEMGYQDQAAAFLEKDGDWSKLADVVTLRSGGLVAGIRSGHFPPEASESGCYACRHRRACRYEQSRIERKKDGAS